jgi:hypothetical protein
VGFVVDKLALGQVFSEYFGFSCQYSFRRGLHIHHHLSLGAGTIGQLVADVTSGVSLTPPKKTKKTKIEKMETLYTIFFNSTSGRHGEFMSFVWFS